jgi:hypothetical protein
MNRESFFATMPSAHPRLWLNGDEVAGLRSNLRADPSHVGWKRFYDQSVQPFIAREPVAEPAPYPQHKRELALWRQIARSFCTAFVIKPLQE